MCASSRTTNLVFTGIFADARAIAFCAMSRLTPSSSNITRPGFTTATHISGDPLPFPMRVSAAFFVMGLSGKSRTQIFPPRLTKRVMAIRLASISRAVIQPSSNVFKPKSPNATVQPVVALPLRRPRCCFLNFTLPGINMTLRSFPAL